MSQESTSGETTQTPAADETQTIPKAHADKLLSETKKAKEEARALKAKLEEIEQANLTKQGEFQKLAEKFKADAEKERENALNLKKSIIQTNVKNALKDKAKEAGLSIDFDKFSKMVNFSEISIDEESGEVAVKDVERVVTSMKAEIPEIFKTTAIKPNNMPLTPTKDGGGPKALHELSFDELKAQLERAK